MSQPTVVVTGAGGFLGWNLMQRPWPGYGYVGVYHNVPAVCPANLGCAVVELEHPEETERIIAGLRPDIVLHFAACTNAIDCERDPEATAAVNVAGSIAVAQACQSVGARMVFASTDMVFDGEHAPYAEDAVPAPISEYGRQKAIAETLVRDACPEAVICRFPLMFGEPGPTAWNFMVRWRSKLEAGEPLQLFTDEYRNPVHAQVALGGLRRVLESGTSGIFNLPGPERISRQAFGLLMCEVLALDAGCIEAVTRAEVDLGAPRPGDTSMQGERARALGYAPPPLREQLTDPWGLADDMAAS